MTGLLVEAMVEILSQCGSEVIVLARVTRDVAQILQDSEDHSNNSKRMRHASSALVDIDTFHTFLMVESFSSVKNLQTYLEDNFTEIFGTKYDIVSFLYSVVLTKGPGNVITERQDMEESLIGELLVLVLVIMTNLCVYRPSAWTRQSELDKSSAHWDGHSERV